MVVRGSRRLVVVGGVAAGLSAAGRARRIDPRLKVTVFERTGFCSYTACGLPYFVAGVIHDYRDLVVRAPEDFSPEGIDVHVHHEVLAVDTAASRIAVRDMGSGKKWKEDFDELLLSTGGTAKLPLKGLDLPGAFPVRTVEDGLAIRQWIAEHKPQRAVIVGGGYIGLEMAEALVAHGIQVCMVEMLEQVLPLVDEEIASGVRKELERAGVEVRCSTPVEAIEGDGRVRQVIAAGEAIDAELVVVGTGVRPDNELARDAGVPLGPHGGVAVDEQMRTAIPQVWAAGDCCETRHLLHDRSAYIPLGTTANKHGRIAGANIAGHRESFAGAAGTAAIKVMDLHVARTGLSEREARNAGLDVAAATIEHRSRARYYPGGSAIKVKMVAERGSGRLLGAQLAGAEGVAKRIDVVAGALYSKATVDDVAGFDLSYAPPFAPVWDPLLIAARELEKAL